MNFVTIPGFEAMTRQQLFDLSLAHIRSTGVKSTRKKQSGAVFKNVCCYGGTGCAAAVFLQPEYRDAFDQMAGGEGYAWTALARAGHVSPHEVEFVSYLQAAHDRAGTHGEGQFMADYENRMRRLAENYDLTYTPPTQPGESAV